MNQLLKNMTRPSDCLLGIALPMTEQAIREDLDKPESRDFARYQLEKKKLINAEDLWHKSGYGDLMKRFAFSLEGVRQLGVSVIPDFRLADLEKVPQYKVFTLLTHWVGSLVKVELHDGFHTAEAFANAIPKGCQSIFDLTVCNSIHLQTAIKKQHPACIVIANEHAADLQFRIVFYKNLLKMLANKPINYVEAFTELRLMLA